MDNVFHACTLPWTVWPWGVDLHHADTDVVPECSMQFGAMIVRPSQPYEQLWIRVEFELAGFASAKPHRDDETLTEVSGYDIVPRRDEHDQDAHARDEASWLSSGICPDPKLYFATDSTWLTAERESWAQRLRDSVTAEDAVHFLVDGRDGYVEILAKGFHWRAWQPGSPRHNEVEGEPIMTGSWTDGASATFA